MTIAPPCMGLNATHPPKASAGLIVTPSSVTFRSVRGNAVAVYVGGHRSLSAERGIDLGPVDLLGVCRGRQHCRKCRRPSGTSVALVISFLRYGL